MPRTATDTATPPPLKALGGWPGADWFCPSVLSDADVVGFTLPKLAGLRKQQFRLVERSVPPPAKRAERAASDASSKRTRAGLTQLLDSYGATRAAAFRRSTFLFESAPVLFFAEFPPANLKIRAADSFRRALVGSAWRACVLGVDARSVLAMFWPAAEQEITAFVTGANPPYALHAQFDQAPAAVQEPGGRPRRAAAEGTRPRPETSLDLKERELLLRELADLRHRVAELQQSQSVLGAMETLGLSDARLKSMLRLLHPDKHGGSEAANEAAKWVNNLRDLLKTGGA